MGGYYAPPLTGSFVPAVFADGEDEPQGGSGSGSSDTGNTTITYEEVPAKAATCTESGTKQYWKGSDNKYYEDAEGKTAIQEDINTWKVIPQIDHKLTKTNKVEASEITQGTEEYWKCSVCNKLFSDEKGEHGIDVATTIPAKGVPIPHAENKEFIYDGNDKELTLTVSSDNFEPAEGSVAKSKNAGDYKAVYKLKNGGTWTDGTTENKTISWKIKKAEATDDMKTASVTLNAEKGAKAAVTFTKLPATATYTVNSSSTDFTAAVDDTTKKVEVTAAGAFSKAGTFTISVKDKNYEDYDITVTVKPKYSEQKKTVQDVGQVSTTVSEETSAPAVNTNLSPDMAAAMLSAEDKKAISEKKENETVEVTVALNVKAAKQDEKQAAAEAVKKLDSKVDTANAEYLDLSLSKVVKVGTTEYKNDAENIPEIEITVPVPSSFPKRGEGAERTYYVFRMHGGAATSLPVDNNGDIDLTFKTDRFSTYMVTYKDTVTAGSAGNNNSGTATTKTTTATAAKSNGGTSGISAATSSSPSSSSGGGGGSSSSGAALHTSGSGSSKAEYSKTSKTGVKYEMSDASTKSTDITVPATVKIGKKTYNVTAIAADAFVGYSKLKSVTVGKNIKKIARNAFSGCSKLTTVTVNSKKLTRKSVGGAFKGTSVKTVYVPADKVDAYRKIFTKKNTGSKNKIKVKAVK